jgi:lipopolysaccharide export system permease protein
VNRIDRYISGLFIGYFIGGLLVFVTMFVAIDAMSLLVSYEKVAGSAVLAYYGYSIPEVVYKMIPVACLLATIFTISTLNKQNELVALYSAGMSIFRISAPLLIGVVMISFFSFFLGDRLLPTFAKNKNFVFYHDIKKNPALYSTTKADRIWYRSKDTIFNIKTLNEQAQKAQGLTLYYFNENWDLLQMITAREVALKGSNWDLQDGSVTLFTEDSSFPLTSKFKTKTIVMGEDSKDLSSTGNTSDVLSLSELSEFIRRNKAAGLDTLKYEVDYHSKYGFAFAAIVMCLLAIPFSVGRARSGGVMVNIGFCLGLVFVYWIFYSSGLTLGNHGQLPPIVAAWAPNLLMAGLAAILILRKKV